MRGVSAYVVNSKAGAGAGMCVPKDLRRTGESDAVIEWNGTRMHPTKQKMQRNLSASPLRGTSVRARVESAVASAVWVVRSAQVKTPAAAPMECEVSTRANEKRGS
eukprot:3232881-Pleurochrysis_carterae.AAC.1